MAKPPTPPAGSAERSGRDELSDLMALLGEDPDEEPIEAADAGDLAELLEEIGASAKEREEQEMLELLERLPELADEAGELVPTVDALPDDSPDSEEHAARIPVLVGVPVLRQSAASAVAARVPPMPALPAPDFTTTAPGATPGAISGPVAPTAPTATKERDARDASSTGEPPVLETHFTLVVEDEHEEPVTLKELFGPPPRRVDLTSEEFQRPPDEIETVEDESELPALPPLRDPLASRRALADKRVRQFLREDVKSPLGFRILRLLMVSGIERVSLDELREELVEAHERVRGTVAVLEASGLLIQEQGGIAINPRARKLALLGTAVAQWQHPRHRDQIWGWLQEQE